jgi:hypothetical protein
MVPLNITEEKLEMLATAFDCQKVSLPFTYLGLPLGTKKPKIEHFMPLMRRIERRLTSTSIFLSQAGKLELVNSVFSSAAIYYTATIKLHKGVVRQLDKYRRHCLWRGSDLNSKKPSKAAWTLVCVPKKQGVLGVLNLNVHNDAMLLKFLHKFFNREDIPWVQLIWNTYYSAGKLPGQHKKGSFWWRDIVKLLHKFKNLTSITVADGSTVLFWKDKWNGLIPAQAYPALLSFAKDEQISFRQAISKPNFIQNFNTPLSVQAHHQLLELQNFILTRNDAPARDQWVYAWGNSRFSTSKAYKALSGERSTLPDFLWIWKSKCQMKHKVFFWLLLKDRLSTRDLLRRKNLPLDSYACELCILQRPETTNHLFLRCNFAKACWDSIGVTAVTSRHMPRAFRAIKDKLAVPFFMEIIILMTWSLWRTRNDWFFNT